MALTNIVSCVILLLPQPCVVSCYGHAMSKCCQYATNDLKVCEGMKEVSIIKVQSSRQKTITWTKKSEKSKQEWAKVYKDASFCP